MSEPCDCIGCAIRALIEERHPNGMDMETAGRLLATFAEMSGFMLANMSLETRIAYAHVMSLGFAAGLEQELSCLGSNRVH